MASLPTQDISEDAEYVRPHSTDLKESADVVVEASSLSEKSERFRSSSEYSSAQLSYTNMDKDSGITKAFSVSIWCVPLLLTIVGITICWIYGNVNGSDDFSRSIFTYVGTSLSIIGAVAVFISDKCMTHWKLHPNPLIYWKLTADFILAITSLLSRATRHPNLSMYDNNCNAAVAGLVQFCLLSSETWFFAMALDLFSSLRNPFSSYKKKTVRYHCMCWGLGFASMVVLLGNNLSGSSTAGICWLKEKEKDSSGNYNNVWVRNSNAILFLYLWLLLYFIASIFVFVMTVWRINSGLRSTYQSRRHVLERTSRTLLIFMLYWVVMGNLYYFGLFKLEHRQDSGVRVELNNIATAMIWALLSGKGFVTAIVWFSVNSLPSFVYHVCTSNGRETMQRKRAHFVGGDCSPQLNQALRKEVLHFTTKGIIEAVSRNPNRPPANWGMNVLVSKENIREFDIELEDKDQANAKVGERNCPALFSRFVNSHIETTRRVKFRDYCPHVFARIRAAFGVSPASYVKSLKYTAKEKLSEGASGAFMFFTKDGKYIVKSTSAQELECLLNILVPYAEYLVNKKNKGSFLTRFYGCHSIRMYSRDYSFVVMANIFNTNKVINQSYDIKGSWVSRHANPIVKGKKYRCRHCNTMFIHRGAQDDSDDPCTERVGPHEPNVVLKDNDLNEKIRLEPTDANKTIEQLVSDSELLGSLGIMDYSLIMGVCNTEYEVQDHRASNRWWGGGKRRRLSIRKNPVPKIRKRLSDADGESFKGEDSESGLEDSNSVNRFVSSKPSSEGAGETTKESDFMLMSRCVVGPEFVYMGMVDILQEWNMMKKLERFAKIVFKREDGDGISAMEPNAYMKRFQQKCKAIFDLGAQNWTTRPSFDFCNSDVERGLLEDDESLFGAKNEGSAMSKGSYKAPDGLNSISQV